MPESMGSIGIFWDVGWEFRNLRFPRGTMGNMQQEIWEQHGNISWDLTDITNNSGKLDE